MTALGLYKSLQIEKRKKQREASVKITSDDETALIETQKRRFKKVNFIVDSMLILFSMFCGKFEKN